MRQCPVFNVAHSLKHLEMIYGIEKQLPTAFGHSFSTRRELGTTMRRVWERSDNKDESELADSEMP